jgi:hypothetical protein
MAKKASHDTVPVSERALTQRLQRKLSAQGLFLKASRGKYSSELGRWYVINERNTVEAKDIDLEQWAREEGALKPWEKLVAA